MPTTVAPRPQADPDLSRTRPARIALVDERSAGVPAHTRYAPTLKALWRRERLLVDAYGLSTAQLEGPWDLAGFDGIWLVPGSPYRGEAAAVSAVHTARERDIPLLATCGGFLHVLLGVRSPRLRAERRRPRRELPRQPASAVTRPRGPRGDCPHRARLTGRGSARRAHDRGALPVHARSGPPVRRHPARPRVAPHHPRRRPPPHRRTAGHRFFLSTLFQPELADDTSRPHPLVRAFASAAVGRSTET